MPPSKNTADLVVAKLQSSKLWMAVFGAGLPLVVQRATHEIGWDKAVLASGVVMGVYAVVQGHADGRQRADGQDSGPKAASRKLWMTIAGALLPIMAQLMTDQIGWDQAALQAVAILIAGISGEGLADGRANVKTAIDAVQKAAEDRALSNRPTPAPLTRLPALSIPPPPPSWVRAVDDEDTQESQPQPVRRASHK